MKKLLSIVILLSFSLLFAAQSDKCWISVEELKKGDKTYKQSTYIKGDLLRTVSERENSRADMIVDFGKNTMTIINHKDKSYQIMNISDYIDFVTKLVESMAQDKNVKPRTYDMKYTYVADEPVGSFASKKYKVAIDGRDRFYVWVSSELKKNVVTDASERIKRLIPASVLEHVNYLQKMKDNFKSEGTIVKTENVVSGDHFVRTSQTLIEFKEIPFVKNIFAIPSDYKDKTQELKSK